ncbi:hypothetical protein Psch_01040 [Pelotomaculum schinkii]|uniref:CXXX repeat peptide modification system protein n=1 Tax=Pelotomaculum schinkii TaxID=78350 RepID=A0A4Y7RFA5_9FIRM|nr:MULTISPECIES: CXXX repeat peptide modification system protein [Pelotomaculum]TEB07486.1 hypothetical protein Psch_01040 [Pelotomaculum schinkii]TEB11021.1 hypothetical protein Psfp_04044 [Pelotomaculum sp. FP]
MNKEKIGILTEEEKNKLEKLHHRKAALSELLMTLSDSNLTNDELDELRKKITIELEIATLDYDEWWKKHSQKYKWKSAINGRWLINDENEVFLTTSI